MGDINLFMFIIAVVGVLFTLTYSVRLVYYIFLNN